eukprot:3250723-Rhodomonas_salina.1
MRVEVGLEAARGAVRSRNESGVVCLPALRSLAPLNPPPKSSPLLHPRRLSALSSTETWERV